MQAVKTIEKYLKLLDKKKALDEEIEIVRNKAMDEMQRSGLNQIKIKDQATVSIVSSARKSVNEIAFRQWANQEHIETDLYYDNVLNGTRVKQLADKVMKETGEIVPFVSVTESEYIRILPIKKDDKNA